MSDSRQTSPERSGDPSETSRHHSIQLDMAGRLIDRAIRMFFEGEDPLFVLAIANPGHVLFHDIARARLQGNNSASKMVARFKAEGLVTEAGRPVAAVSDLMAVLRRDANSLKHIGVAPSVSSDSVLATLMVAATDAQDLRVMSPVQLLFVAWLHARQGLPEVPAWDLSEMIFPGLMGLSDSQQRHQGWVRLSDENLTGILAGLCQDNARSQGPVSTEI